MIGDTVAATLPYLQAQAESLMADTCSVDRPGEPVMDPETGVVTTPTTNVYAGRCKVQTYEPYEQTPDVGSSSPTVQRYSLHVPIAAGPFEVGDVATVGARRFRIAGPHRKTWQTAQRLLVDEMTTTEGA